MILGIHHAQITIPSGAEDDARAFYCGILKLEEIAKPEALSGRGGFWLQAGDRQIHVGVEDGIQRSITKAHVAYLVDDLEAWRNELGGLGVHIIDGISIPGYVRFEFRDPFGNRIEFLEQLTA